MPSNPTYHRLPDFAVLAAPSKNGGDVELIRLFAVRNDPRLGPYLLAQIRADQDAPTAVTSDLVQALGWIINDPVVSEIRGSDIQRLGRRNDKSCRRF